VGARTVPQGREIKVEVKNRYGYGSCDKLFGGFKMLEKDGLGES
jgi:hypothetical protein